MLEAGQRLRGPELEREEEAYRYPGTRDMCIPGPLAVQLCVTVLPQGPHGYPIPSIPTGKNGLMHPQPFLMIARVHFGILRAML
eukprot:2302967-Rhodomonas_salina.1